MIQTFLKITVMTLHLRKVSLRFDIRAVQGRFRQQIRPSSSKHEHLCRVLDGSKISKLNLNILKKFTNCYFLFYQLSIININDLFCFFDSQINNSNLEPNNTFYKCMKFIIHKDMTKNPLKSKKEIKKACLKEITKLIEKYDPYRVKKNIFTID